MLDFASVLYLGFTHPKRALRPWAQLTVGVPAALREPPVAPAVAAGLAALQCSEAGVVAASSLHLMWDLFGVLAREHIVLLVDRAAYPIVQWGVERASTRGVPVRRFQHFDPQDLARHLKQVDGRRPVVVLDGFCPSCGLTAPLEAVLDQVRRRAGMVVIDDTQALGLTGVRPSPNTPWGKSGGGTLAHTSVRGAEIVVVASLAKAFGVPLAALSGGSTFIARFRQKSETRLYCSPPSAAALHAARRALNMNHAQGDRRRSMLLERIRQFRNATRYLGISLRGRWSPMQTLDRLRPAEALRLHEELHRSGIRSVLHRPHGSGLPAVSFLFSTRHSAGDVDRLASTLGRLLGKPRAPGSATEDCNAGVA